MKFRIESPGFKPSPSLKEFATQKLKSLDRFYKDIHEIEVTLLNDVKAGKEKAVSSIVIKCNFLVFGNAQPIICLLYTSPSPRDRQKSRMPSSA